MRCKPHSSVDKMLGADASENLISTIERITDNGDTAEVKKTKEGTYKVYAVKKKVEMA